MYYIEDSKVRTGTVDSFRATSDVIMMDYYNHDSVRNSPFATTYGVNGRWHDEDQLFKTKSELLKTL